MDIENDINRRDEMLSRFRESLRRPISERYFDEDELLEIFDYAGDVNDDYLRLEAMLCAARFYPDSKNFIDRRAIFYSQFSDSIRDRFLEDTEGTNTLILELLKIKSVAQYAPNDTMTMFTNLVKDNDDFTDEEVIQIIDTASVYGDTKWIRENLPMLRAKVSYINILLYEIAVAAARLGDTDLAVKMLEELTEIEPYNPYFWIMLASEYANQDLTGKAVTAIEFALAINPDDPNALFIKAKLLYSEDKNDRQVIDLALKALNSDEGNFDMAKFIALIYKERGENAHAAEVMKAYYDTHRDEVLMIVPDILLFEPDNAESLLEDFYDANVENHQMMWATWAHQLMLSGFTNLARLVIDTYTRKSNSPMMSLIQVESCFKEGDYQSALSYLRLYLECNNSMETEFPTITIVHLLSMLRLGETDNALKFCEYILSTTNVEDGATVAKRIEYIGLRRIVEHVHRCLMEDVPQDYWMTYDPLKIWSSPSMPKDGATT